MSNVLYFYRLIFKGVECCCESAVMVQTPPHVLLKHRIWKVQCLYSESTAINHAAFPQLRTVNQA